MTSDVIENATTIAQRQHSFVPTLRIAFAALLTAAALPYTWAYNFISAQLAGKLQPFFAVGFVFAVAAIMALTWHVGETATWRRRRRFIVVAVAITWILINVAMFSRRLGALIPPVVVIAAYVPGSLLVPWVAWMFFCAGSWRARLAVTAVLWSLMLAFIAVFRVDGLSGDSNVDFSWRFAESVRGRPVTAVVSARGISTDERLIENPECDYPQFLGPDRAAVVEQAVLYRDWTSQPPHELWRRPVGSGWSSFAVVGNYAFTQEQRGDQECVACYRVSSGEELWVHAEPVNFTSSLGGPGPRATPTVARGRVFAVGATGILNCLDALSGRRIWSVDILKDNQSDNISHGVCASPLVLGDQVLVCPTGSHGPSLAAYDLSTGRRVWAKGTHGASYSSPIATELAGRSQILLFGTAGLTAHDCQTGDPLWHFAWTNAERTNVAQPIIHAGDPNQIFVSTGYSKGCALIRVEQRDDGGWSVDGLWDNTYLKTKFCTAVLYGDHVFGLDDGILTCIHLKSGKRAWKAGRYGHGQILRAGDLLIVQAEDGDVVLGELNPRQWRELGRIKALTGKTWNNPALAGPYLLVRNDHEAACFELPLRQTSTESQADSPGSLPASSPSARSAGAPEVGGTYDEL